MKFLKSLDLRFTDKRKENEFMTIKNQNMGLDFHAAMITMILSIGSGLLESLIRQNGGYVIHLATLSSLIVIYIIRCFCKRATLFLIIVVIFIFNITRLVLLGRSSTRTSPTINFFGGYAYAILYAFLLKNIPSTFFRIWIVIINYIIRIGFVLIWIDMSAGTKAGLFFRAAIVDLFILFYYHLGEKTDRKVFLNFDEKREELLKFKELLADYLPLGIIVVELQSLNSLFTNFTYQNLFDNESIQVETFPTRSQILRDQREHGNYLSLLQVDENTIRIIGDEQPSLQSNSVNNDLKSLEAILKNFVVEGVFKEKAISLIAYDKNETSPKTFDVMIKKVKWNGVDALAVVLNDITFQEKLIYWKTTNENKDKIIATVSHELRTPLNGILGLIDMAEKKIKEREVLEYTSLCKDNANLLLSLVNSILDLHQIRARKLKLVISNLNIRKCLQGVVQLFQFQTSQKGISISVSIQDKVSEVIKTDENRLKQIIINLIGNAIKFTIQGGIKVTVADNEQEPKYLKISVTDTGMGIKEEDICKLFKVFGKLEEGEIVNKYGVGLGLIISNALAKLLSGKEDGRGIEVTSRYNEGSCFSFNILKDLNYLSNNHANNQLKLEKNKQVEDISDFSAKSEDLDTKMINYQTSSKINLSHPSTKPLNLTSLELDSKNKEFFGSIDSPKKDKIILIVDDNPFNILVAGNLVKEIGYSVKTASGGHEAIKLMEEFTRQGLTITAILMDYQMPVMNGFEASQILNEMMNSGKVIKVPIIALTADDSEETIKRCYESGMAGHLMKPTSKNLLLEVLSKTH